MIKDNGAVHDPLTDCVAKQKRGPHTVDWTGNQKSRSIGLGVDMRSLLCQTLMKEVL